jgi:hypothetical protein
MGEMVDIAPTLHDAHACVRSLCMVGGAYVGILTSSTHVPLSSVPFARQIVNGQFRPSPTSGGDRRWYREYHLPPGDNLTRMHVERHICMRCTFCEHLNVSPRLVMTVRVIDSRFLTELRIFTSLTHEIDHELTCDTQTHYVKLTPWYGLFK